MDSEALIEQLRKRLAIDRVKRQFGDPTVEQEYWASRHPQDRRTVVIVFLSALVVLVFFVREDLAYLEGSALRPWFGIPTAR